jgi:hypothetical protein
VDKQNKNIHVFKLISEYLIAKDLKQQYNLPDTENTKFIAEYLNARY